MGWEYSGKDYWGIGEDIMPYQIISATNLVEKEYSFVQCVSCGKSILMDFPFIGAILCYECMMMVFYSYLRGLLGEDIEVPGQTTTNYMGEYL